MAVVKLGRPLKTTADFPKDWQKVVLDMMSEGASQAEVQAYLDISDKTMQRMLDDEVIFFRTIKKGLRLSKAWWEREGRESLRDKDFSYVGWYMNMKNRFGWRDKQDVTTNNKDLPTPLLNNVSGNYSYTQTTESEEEA
jgi:hypothetical protein